MPIYNRVKHLKDIKISIYFQALTFYNNPQPLYIQAQGINNFPWYHNTITLYAIFYDYFTYKKYL